MTKKTEKSSKLNFKKNEYVVYPAHGVGKIIGIEEQKVAGTALRFYVIMIEKDKMTLRVPVHKVESAGMRRLSEVKGIEIAFKTLQGRPRVRRTMWSRRAQEYEAKINSGDIKLIAEVVRDLYRSESQQEQSYSERQLYEAALDRMAREVAIVDKSTEQNASEKIEDVLAQAAARKAAKVAKALAENPDQEAA